MIKETFLPINNEQLLWEQLHYCNQGARSIHQYTAEYQRLQARTNLFESPSYQMIMYVNGLKKDIKERVEMYTMSTISDAISLAYKAEKQLQASSCFYPHKSLRNFSTLLSFEPKLEHQTPNQSSNQTSQKELPKPYSNPTNKSNFIPLQNNP